LQILHGTRVTYNNILRLQITMKHTVSNDTPAEKMTGAEVAQDDE
jgi:hypothetical protein